MISAALGQFAGDVLGLTDQTSSDGDARSVGSATLDIFERIAVHVMEDIQSTALDPMSLLNIICGPIDTKMRAKLGSDSDPVANNAYLDGVEDEKVAALRALGLLAAQADLNHVAALCTRLGNEDVVIREAARKAFCQILDEEASHSDHGRGGDNDPIVTLLAHLDSDDLDIKAMALEKIPQVVGRGNDCAICAVRACLAATDVGVRCEAIKALCKLVVKGDYDTITAALSFLLDDDRFVRAAAVEAIGQVVDKGVGDERVIIAITDCLDDEDRFVRRAAERLLSQVAEKHDRHVIAALCGRLQHERGDVRCTAARMLAQFADARDQSTMMALMAHLEDDDANVREAVAQSLSELLQTLQAVESEIASSSLVQ